jgi:hypothetical protein
MLRDGFRRQTWGRVVADGGTLGRIALPDAGPERARDDLIIGRSGRPALIYGSEGWGFESPRARQPDFFEVISTRRTWTCGWTAP